jgi:hypothetical protein
MSSLSKQIFSSRILSDRNWTIVIVNLPQAGPRDTSAIFSFEIVGNHRTSMGDENNGDWVVKESWGRLIVSVDGKKINITDALKVKGYFYYDYRDEANILHRLYIVKNAGGTKDYAERWYSQQEWLPELGMGGGSRGMSGPLGQAIVLAEIDVKEDGKDLDAMLKKRLEKYWTEYGE